MAHEYTPFRRPFWKAIREQMEWYALADDMPDGDVSKELRLLKREYRERGATALVEQGWIEDCWWQE